MHELSVNKINMASNGALVCLDSLPNEILIHICSFLDARFVLETVSQVCSRLQDLIADDSLWKIRTKRRFAKTSPFPPIDPTSELKWRNICAEQEEFFARPQEGVVKAQVKGHYASVDALLLVPCGGDKELLISGSRDRSVGLWDPQAMLDEDTSKARVFPHSLLSSIVLFSNDRNLQNLEFSS